MILVGSDTGGAICQFLLDEDASRVGHLVLTNCDAFETFPPVPFNWLFRLGRHPRAARVVLGATRVAAVRNSRLGFGWLVRRRLTADESRPWVTPYLTDAGVRRDVAAFLNAWRADDLADVATRLPDFDRPVLLCWAPKDPFFKIGLGRRLAATFPDARLVEFPDARTFVSLDQPARLATRSGASSGRRLPPMPVDAVIFDWGGTLTRWHDVDFHAESLALAQAVVNAPHHDATEITARLHAAGDAVWGRSRDHQQSATVADLFDEAGLDHDPALLTAYYEFWEPHTFTDPEVGPLFEALRADGIKVGVLSNTIWPRAWHEGFFERDGVRRPDRRRRLHQRDPVDEAVAGARSRRRWTPSARPTRPGASTWATGSSTTSGAPTTRACGPSTSRTADPAEPGRPHRGRPDAVVAPLAEIPDLVRGWA